MHMLNTRFLDRSLGSSHNADRGRLSFFDVFSKYAPQPLQPTLMLTFAWFPRL